MEPADGTAGQLQARSAMNLWMQVYNLQPDDKTKKPSAKIEYEIVNIARQSSRCCTPAESTDSMGNVGDQMTLEKRLALNSLAARAVQADGESRRQRLEAADRAFGTICCRVAWRGPRQWFLP